jgi:hypothetical protein
MELGVNTAENGSGGPLVLIKCNPRSNLLNYCFNPHGAN